MKTILMAVIPMVTFSFSAFASGLPCSEQASEIALKLYQQQTNVPGVVLQLIPQPMPASIPQKYAYVVIARSLGGSNLPTIQVSMVLNGVCNPAYPNAIRVVSGAK